VRRQGSLAPPRGQRARARGRSNPVVPYAFVAPALFVFCAFALIPIALGLCAAAFRIDPVLRVCEYVGARNFATIASDPPFHIALRNNLLWILLSIGVQIPLALLLAAALIDQSRFCRALRTVFFSPLVIPGVAIGIMFSIVLDGQFGALNAALSWVEGHQVTVGWTADRRWALFCLIAVACWQYTGYHMMVLLAGMQGIPTELYEAAEIDGAGWWQRLGGITLPLLRRVMLADVLLVAIGSVKVFDIVQVMTQGGPNNATEVLATYMYSQAFMSERMGSGAAVAVVMLIITLGFAVIHSRLARLEAGAP